MPISRRRFLAGSGGAFLSGAACYRRTVLLPNRHPVYITLTVDLVDGEEEGSLLHHVGFLQVGQAMRVLAEDRDGETLELALKIEHYSAAQEALTIRANYSKAGQLVLAPVFVVRPEEVAEVEIGVDDGHHVLSVAASVVRPESRSDTMRVKSAMPASMRSSSKSKSG